MFSDGRSARFTHLSDESGDRADTRVRVELFEANGTLARTMTAKSQRGAFRVWDAWATAEPAKPQRCGNDDMSPAWECTRRAGHAGEHSARDGSGTRRWS